MNRRQHGKRRIDPIDTNEHANSEHPLKGIAFHSFKDDGELFWQGRVLDVLDGRVYVQLYSWLDGSETTVSDVTIEEFMSPRFERYSSHELMNERWENLYSEFVGGDHRPERANRAKEQRARLIANWLGTAPRQRASGDIPDQRRFVKRGEE